ncbi:hypothetical protein JB92DRAFT_2829296 [Gautieria morchelliformis]|nr:hypothetical protein JB92DRAFT_2829296 [Gautieria morchelliformis]
MAPNESSSLSVLIERTRVKLKVRPDLRGALREEVEQWVVEAEELQAELRATLRVEAIADPNFERPSEVDDLAREVKEAKEWFGSEPEVLGVATKEPRIEGDSVREPEDEGEGTRTPKKARKERTRSPSPEVVVVEPTPAQRRKGRANALVAESDKVPQSVAKHGYPEHAYLLGWLIYNGHEVLKRPAKCGRCLRYGHTCSGEAGKMFLVPPLEYVAKDEKDSREPVVKERGLKGKSKGKAKEKGSTAGCPWHLNVCAGRRGEGGGSGGEVGGVDEECVSKAQRFERRGVRTRGGPGDA